VAAWAEKKLQLGIMKALFWFVNARRRYEAGFVVVMNETVMVNYLPANYSKTKNERLGSRDKEV
jgi:hypothetical protein